MAQYHVHFVDRGDRIVNALMVEQEADEVAVEHAKRLYIPSIGNGFDVWCEDRLVYRRRN